MISLRAYFKNRVTLPTRDPLSWIRIALNAIIAVSLIALSYFLYTDFYKTLVQAQAVVVLQQEVSLQDVNLSLFETIQNLHNYKLERPLKPILRDPFETDQSVKVANEAATTTAPVAGGADPQGILPTL